MNKISLILVILIVGVAIFAAFIAGKSKSINPVLVSPTPSVKITGTDLSFTPTITPNVTQKIQYNMIISSTAFPEGGDIPAKYTCDGLNILPPLVFEGIPSEAKSLALVIDDPDAPGGTFTHFLAWNIDPKITEIKSENDISSAVRGTNSFNKTAYGGPCPPSGTHRYFFKLFAIDELLKLGSGSKISQLETSISEHLITKTELMGKYTKK